MGKKNTRDLDRISHLPKISKFMCHRSGHRTLFSGCKPTRSLCPARIVGAECRLLIPYLPSDSILRAGPALPRPFPAGQVSGHSVCQSGQVRRIWLPELLWLPWHLPWAPLSINLGVSCFAANGGENRKIL